jgi:hypothetical protein
MERHFKTKLLAGGALLGSFLGGAMFRGFTSPGEADAFSPPPSATAVTPSSAPHSQPAARVVERPVVYQTPSQQEAPQRGRSWEREVLIVAGSSGAGAAIGGVAGGGKGAAIGAVSGGVAGLIYDIATRDK